MFGLFIYLEISEFNKIAIIKILDQFSSGTPWCFMKSSRRSIFDFIILSTFVIWDTGFPPL